MKYRAIWISDVHLGSKHAQAGPLLSFLKENESDYLYIVGDFIDGWELKRSWHWLSDYNVLIQKILRKDRKQTRVTVVHGNHDEFLQDYLGIRFGQVTLCERVVHTGLNGRRYLVLHGHQFDGLTTFNRLLERVGSRLYDIILSLNLFINRIRRRLGFGYWSFSSYLKMKAKKAVQYIGEFENAMVMTAGKHRVHGVICGHIHRAEIKNVRGLEYMNCGDWVESCSALVEEMDGTFKIINHYENTIHRAGGGQGAHDTGSVPGPDAPKSRPHHSGRPGREESTPELAGFF
jgi:UDP-2,3-diacylglucosamine pyrophosphatase LpxH